MSKRFYESVLSVFLLINFILNFLNLFDSQATVTRCYIVFRLVIIQDCIFFRQEYIVFCSFRTKV